MPEKTIDERIAAYLSGNLAGDERRGLLSWIDAEEANRHYFDQTVSLWAMANEYNEEIAVDTPSAWDRFESRIDTLEVVDSAEVAQEAIPQKETIVRKLPGRWFAIAAAILFICTFSFWWFFADHQMQIETLANEQRKVELPDGSEVWLNENSRLTYDARFKERTLALEGEAYFSVARDSLSPFSIHTGSAVTTVLGTSFNLRAYEAEEEVTVSVLTGKVVLEDENEPEDRVELTPGESGVFSKPADAVILAPKTVSNPTAWKEQKLDFTHTPLEIVLPVLERYFGKKITVTNPDILNCTLFGQYEKPELDEIIEAMAFTIDLEVDRSQADQIIIGGPGCN